MKKNLSLVLLAAGIIMVSTSLRAHHSDSTVDQDKLITITGPVTKYEFINPHQLIHLAVKGADGTVTEWIAYGGSPNQMRAVGWSSNLIKVGEVLTIYGFPFRDGKPVMIHGRILRADGTDLPSDQHETDLVRGYVTKHGKEMPPAEFADLSAFLTKTCAQHPVNGCPGR